jgi:hypothetical protein
MLFSFPFTALAITNFILRVKYYKDTLEDIPVEDIAHTNEVFITMLVACLFAF